MRAAILALVASVALGIQAQDVDDIPFQCQSVCSAVVQTTSNCDLQYDDDDSRFLECVCQSQNARSRLPNCEACVARYDEVDNDVRDLVSSCGFSVQTTFSAGPTAAPTITRTSSAPTATWTDNDPYDDYDYDDYLDNNDPNNDYDDDDNDDDDDDDYSGGYSGNDGNNSGNSPNSGSNSGSGSGSNSGGGSGSGNSNGNGNNAASGMGIPLAGSSLFALAVVVAML